MQFKSNLINSLLNLSFVLYTYAFTYETLNNPLDLTFNQLLGINNNNTIVGYYGSGSTGHPNEGYILDSQNNFISANVPNSVQTQDICINNKQQIGGFWIDTNGITYGFLYILGNYITLVNPNTGNGTVNQILGINDGNFAVGFYTDFNDINNAYSYDIINKNFYNIVPPSCVSTTATSTNNYGDVVGFCNTTSNIIVSFFANNGNYITFNYPSSTNTQALGINNNRQIVGSYVDLTGNTHGFIVTNINSTTQNYYQQIDHPDGINGTILNGINDFGYIVGFYTDSNSNTNGLLLSLTTPLPSQTMTTINQITLSHISTPSTITTTIETNNSIKYSINILILFIGIFVLML